MQGPDWNSIISALPGVFALVAAAVGYGKLQARLTNVEKAVDKLTELHVTVTRIDERGKHTDDAVKEVRDGFVKLNERLFDGAIDLLRRASEGRTFHDR